MNRPASSHRQRGATLVVGLIMLVLITLMVSSAFTLSTTNLKSVGNMQIRNEAIAAANAAMETVLSTSPVATTTAVYIGDYKYNVTIAISPCLSATKAASGSLSSLSLPVGMSSSSYWNILRDIEATVSDSSSGAFVRVHQGARYLLSQTDKDTQCP